jgi:molecular chaperone DnaK
VDGEKQFEVLSTNGDTFLGGEDFDQRVIDYIIEEFKKVNGLDLKKIRSPCSVSRLRPSAKIELSSSQQTEINEPYIAMANGAPVHLTLKMTRAKLESLVEELINATIEPCRTAIKDAGVKVSDIDDMILVGGMTRMPKVQESEGVLRQGSAQGREPGRSRGRRCCDPGFGAVGRAQGPAAAGRDPAVAGYRNPGRRDDQDDPQEHHDPDQVLASVLDRRRQPACGDHQGLPGRARNRGRQQGLGEFNLEGIPPAARGTRRSK